MDQNIISTYFLQSGPAIDCVSHALLAVSNTADEQNISLAFYNQKKLNTNTRFCDNSIGILE